MPIVVLRRKPHRDVLADGGDVGQPRMAFQGGDEAFDERAGHPGGKVEALGLEEGGELLAGHVAASDAVTSSPRGAAPSRTRGRVTR
jgi:hypothetical protein